MDDRKDYLKTNRGFLADLMLKIQLTIKLIGDSRVQMIFKIIPVLCLLYLIIPTDLLFGPIDDAVILYFGMDFFIDLCPEVIVQEHLSRLQGKSSSTTEDVIDVDFKE